MYGMFIKTGKSNFRFCVSVLKIASHQCIRICTTLLLPLYVKEVCKTAYNSNGRYEYCHQQQNFSLLFYFHSDIKDAKTQDSNTFYPSKDSTYADSHRRLCLYQETIWSIPCKKNNSLFIVRIIQIM